MAASYWLTIAEMRVRTRGPDGAVGTRPAEPLVPTGAAGGKDRVTKTSAGET